MARIILSGGSPITNRRGGLVYASQLLNPTVRSGPLPIIPKTGAQNAAQTTFAAGAATWFSIGPTAQGIWNAAAPAGSSGYALFLAQAQLAYTWGVGTVIGPGLGFSILDSGVLACGNTPSTSDCFLRALGPGQAVHSYDMYLRLYMQGSSLNEILYSGSSGSTPGRPGAIPYLKPSGYVYIGSYGPFQPYEALTFDLTDQVYALLGRQPTAVTYDATTNQFYGSQQQIRFYWTNVDGQILTLPGTATWPQYATAGWFDAPPF